jgi:hypothetical protein
MIIHVCMIEESNKCQSFCNLNNSTLWLRVLADKSVERYKATSTEGGRQLLKPIFSSWLPAQVIVVYSCEIGSPFPHCNSASTLNVCFLLCFQMPVTCAQWLKCQCPWITAHNAKAIGSEVRVLWIRASNTGHKMMIDSCYETGACSWHMGCLTSSRQF